MTWVGELLESCYRVPAMREMVLSSVACVLHRLLIELNEAWKVDDPTILPKGKRQAKFDMEGDEEIQMQFPSREHVAVHFSHAPCPVPPEETSRGFEMHHIQPEPRLNESPDKPGDTRQKPLQER